ncbi:MULTISPECIES: DMT family transporter [unclassified Kitasatospora]|uniref:DMT family transporter n=1 Tax=unclassified Kitasatospora TaxID=2633591 RepID=UPI003401ACE1
MPIALIALSVLLQAGTEGFLSGRLDPAGSLLFSCLAFLATAVVFTLTTVLRGKHRGALADREVRRLLVQMNLASALTFLGYFVALAWVPAALAASLMAGVGPLAVAVLGAARGVGGPGRAGWLRAGALLAVSLAVAACTRSGETAAIGPEVLGGGLLAVLSGFGAAHLATVSRKLGDLKVDPVVVTAHRFHLTYLLAGVLLAAQEGGPTGHGLSLGAASLAAVAGVVVPLYLLQIGAQRCPPVITMVLLTTLPGLTYLAQVLFGDRFRPLSAVLITALVALAVLFTRLEARPRRSPAATTAPAATSTDPATSTGPTASTDPATTTEGDRDADRAGTRGRGTQGVRLRP